jgi:hypothetical protein
MLEPAEFAKRAFIIALAAFFVAIGAGWLAHRLPEPAQIMPEIKFEPIQKEVSLAPIYRREPKAIYEIKPRFTYHLYGLVVATHNSKSWNDISHASWHDSLNEADICVVWGASAVSGVLNDLNFTHGDWTCYVKTDNSESWSKFHLNQMSNNHILPATEKISKAIAVVEIGDQIEIDGYLSDYSINGSGERRTSITREDTGNGACEIIYAQTFRRLSRTNAKWIIVRKGSYFLSGISLLAALFSMFALPFFKWADN